MDVDGLRAGLLRPFHASFSAPVGVGLYLFDGGSWVIENFNEVSAQTELNGRRVTVEGRGWVYEWK
jgi:hypothetical protein